METGKKRSQSQVTGELAVNFLRSVFPKEWVLREFSPDYGLDVAIEIFEKYKNNFITTGEHIYFQVKGTYSLNIGKLKIYERMNVEKELSKKGIYKEIDVIKFPVETSLLATVERMGSAVPVVFIIVDLENEKSYFLCLNDYIEKVVVPDNPDYIKQKSITLHIPLINEIKSVDDVYPINWYAKRAKLFALFSKVNYQKNELNYILDDYIQEDIVHFVNILLRSDAWSASKYFNALKVVQDELAYYLKTGDTKMAVQIISTMQKRGVDVDDEVWETNYSNNILSFRSSQNANGIRNIWDQLCNCGNILEDLAKEWFLPTYVGLITRGI